MEPQTIHGQLSSDDYLQSVLLNLKPIRKIFSIIATVFILMFLVLLISNWAQAIMIIVYIIPIAIIPFAFAVWRYLLLPRKINRIFNQQKELGSPFIMEISEDYFRISNEYGQSNRPWSDFIKWKENKHVFSLYHSDVMLTVIPKRLLINQEQINNLQNILSNNIVPSKANRSSRTIIIFVMIIFAVILSFVSYKMHTP
ncbi:MAG: hypothetical protein BA864_14435 [Desulfuromonadales bacterium C00003093]|nr:MAG: hypothetical protein BA864_14435 [Desulfuromonadales bacterium C00003093]